MSSASVARSYIVAASIAAVEALKDQGFARWNYTLRSVHQHLKKPILTGSKAATPSRNKLMGNKKMKKQMPSPEDRARKVLEINCWGPSTLRF